MKKICIFLLCTFLMTSCVYWGMYHFSDDDLVWLSPYDEGDTILFRSETDEMDTLIVNEKYVKDIYWPFMENEARNVMEAYGFLDIDVIHQMQLTRSSVSITKKDGDELAVLIAFAHRVQECEQSELRMEEMEIDGVFYSDACLCKGKDFSSPNDIKSEYFIWSKSKGLLQYKYLNGEVYTFYKKIPRKK